MEAYIAKRSDDIACASDTKFFGTIAGEKQFVLLANNARKLIVQGRRNGIESQYGESARSIFEYDRPTEPQLRYGTLYFTGRVFELESKWAVLGHDHLH